MQIPRGWTNADAVVATREFLAARPPRRAATRALIQELLTPDPYTRRCAADLARRISAREPGVLKAYAGVTIDLVGELPLNEWQARGYLTLASALNATTAAERMRLVPVARRMIDDERIALRAIALEAFALLALAEPALREEAMLLMEHYRVEGCSAMRSRAKLMLQALMKAEQSTRVKRAAGHRN